MYVASIWWQYNMERLFATSIYKAVYDIQETVVFTLCGDRSLFVGVYNLKNLYVFIQDMSPR